MSMYSPEVSRTSSHARGPRPLSITCVRPPPRTRPRSKPRQDVLQLLVRGCLPAVGERGPVGAVHDHLVAGAELQDLAGVGDREGDLVRRHQRAPVAGASAGAHRRLKVEPPPWVGKPPAALEIDRTPRRSLRSSRFANNASTAAS